MREREREAVTRVRARRSIRVCSVFKDAARARDTSAVIKPAAPYLQECRRSRETSLPSPFPPPGGRGVSLKN